MLAGAALQSGIDFQPEAARRAWVRSRHGATTKNFSPTSSGGHASWVCCTQSMSGAFDGITESSGGFAIFEERFQPAIVLDDAEVPASYRSASRSRLTNDRIHLALDALLFTGPEFFFEDHLANFSGAGFGQRLGGKFDDARQLEFAQALFAGTPSTPPASRDSPGFSTTMAAGTSPHLSLGAATTAHSNTAGCEKIARSTSMDEIFSPPEMMISFLRSTMWM